MALVVPEFLQTETYTGKRMRLAYSHMGAKQPGVFGAGDLAVTAGTGMNMNVAAGHALVPATQTGNVGLYHVENDASMTATVPTAHASLPRLDQIVLRANDSADGGDANDTPSVYVLAGTATAAATLNNRSGATALPVGHIRLADLIVAANQTSFTNSALVDRRPWARGVNWVGRRASTSLTTVSGSYNPIDTTLMIQRVELSGGMVYLGLYGEWGNSAQGRGYLRFTYSTAGGLYNVCEGYNAFEQRVPVTGWQSAFSYVFCWLPPLTGGAATSFLIRPEWNTDAGTMTMYATSGFPLTMHISEEIRPSAYNEVS